MGTLVNLLKEMAVSGASDLILTSGAPPQLRIHGHLRPIDGHPALRVQNTHDFAREILNDDQMIKLERDKSLDMSKGFEGLARFRINVFHQRDAIGLAIRIIPSQVQSFESLGIPPVARQFASLPNGLVLITGPAGSGKSTTLAAMIDYINHDRRVHVICIEDPIEYLHTHHKSIIEQIEILSDAHSFADALRCVFRQSPDVIMVGEMRDLETIRLTLTLAETGHLILATLHTQDTTHAINRIVDSVPPDQQHQVYVQLALVLRGIISQQLIITRDGSRRVLACEVMNVNNAIRNLIREKQMQQIYSVIQTGRAEGMVTMNDSLRELFRAGLIDADVAFRRSPRPKELNSLIDLQKF